MRVRILFFLSLILYNLDGQNLVFEQFTDRDGLPSTQTYNVIQDSTGLLWIGTENGLVSYDGDQFRSYSHPEFLDNDIVRVGVNRSGRIFFLNISGQLAYINNDEVFLVDLSDLPDKLRDLVFRKNKDVLICRTSDIGGHYELEEIDEGKFSIKKTKIKYYNFFNDNEYEKISANKFLCINDSSYLAFREVNSDVQDEILLTAVSSNSYLLTTVDSNLNKIINGEYYQRLVKNNEHIFIVKGKGVIYYNSMRGTLLPFYDNLSINTIFFDLEGNAWLSTRNRGLLRVPNLIFKLNQKINEVNTGINDIVKTKNGNILLGSLFSKIIINPQSDNISFDLTAKNRPIRFYEDNGIVYGYEDTAISLIDDSDLSYEKIQQGYTHKDLLVDGTNLYSISNVGFTKYNLDNYLRDIDRDALVKELISARPSCLYYDKQNSSFYMGSTKGIWKAALDSFNFRSIPEMENYSLSTIIEGSDLSMIIGTKANGVITIRNDSIVDHITTADGLISNNINRLALYENELLISTNAGLNIFDLATRSLKVVNKYNFLPSDEVLVSRVIDGEYWIGTSEGLTILKKEEVENLNAKGPLFSLRNMRVNGIAKTYKPRMHLNHTENNIQLSFQNISYSSGRDKLLKYRIPKVDSSWVTISDPTIRLTTLKPGTYSIEAIGVNAVGIESLPVHLEFTVDLPWWETIWARLLFFMLVFLAGYLIILNRSNRIRKEESTKRDYISQINRIKDQALQLQMNPHFIFNSLNAIQGFIGTDKEEMAMNYLARFARLIRLIFEYSKGSSITLEEELDFIKLYLNLEKLRFQGKVSVSLHVDEELDSNKDFIKIPPLLIQPIVENAFKHGLFHKKGTGHLNITYALTGNLLKITVEDDGVGRAESERITLTKDKNHVSSGIKTTKERIELLNFGQQEPLNTIEVVDLYDDQKLPTGTRVIIQLEI